MTYEVAHRKPTLAPGHALFMNAGHPALRLPSGDLVAINLSRLGVTDAGSRFSTVTGSGDSAAIQDLMIEPRFEQALIQAGFAEYDTDSGWPPDHRHIAVGGSGQIADAVAHLLRRAGCVVDRAVDLNTTDLNTIQAVCWSSDGPAPASWLTQEPRLMAAGTAWLRVSVEGALAYLEPLAYGGSKIDHRMVRSRRLAAARHPEALLSLWQGSGIIAAYPLSAAAAGAVADLMFADLRDWAISSSTETLSSGQRLRVFDLRDLSFVDHPIMPIPDAHRRDR